MDEVDVEEMDRLFEEGHAEALAGLDRIQATDFIIIDDPYLPNQVNSKRDTKMVQAWWEPIRRSLGLRGIV